MAIEEINEIDEQEYNDYLDYMESLYWEERRRLENEEKEYV
jgi:hypothetical protein